MPVIGNALDLNIGNAYISLMRAIDQVVKNFGSQEATANALGVSQPTVSEWVRGERPVPTRRCTQIEQHPVNSAAEQSVMRWDLRPDDWWMHWPELKKVKGAPAIKTEAV